MKEIAVAALWAYAMAVEANSLWSVEISGGAGYGNPKCPCIGIDNVKGVAEYNGTKYPLDLGARCEAWDESSTSTCKGDSAPAWCKREWCYVDPCNCHIPEPPKHSSYFPEASYNGKLLYYSYATCGAVDHYTAKYHKKACINHKTQRECAEFFEDDACSWIEDRCMPFELSGVCEGFTPNEDRYGKADCRCVGVAGIPGYLEMKNGLKYPADTGASCDTWDKQAKHPECGKDKPQEWCEQRWCYVDPCRCNLPEGQPEQAYLLRGAIFQGKPLYYSYATCGAENKFSGQFQCNTKTSKAACSDLADCVWNGTSCLGWELGGLCDVFKEQKVVEGELKKITAPLNGKADAKTLRKAHGGKLEVETEDKSKSEPSESLRQPSEKSPRQPNEHAGVASVKPAFVLLSLLQAWLFPALF